MKEIVGFSNSSHNPSIGRPADLTSTTPRLDGSRCRAVARRFAAPRPQPLNLIAKYAKLSYAPASSPSNWRTRMRIPIILAIAALVLSGCNANQGVNPASPTAPGVVAGPDFPGYNAYDPSKYAQTSGFYSGSSGGR
jgi:hypothetical protein